MDRDQLEAKILSRGREFLDLLSGQTPSMFNKGW